MSRSTREQRAGPESADEWPATATYSKTGADAKTRTAAVVAVACKPKRLVARTTASRADAAVPASCQLAASSHVAVCARRHTANDTIGLSWEAKTPSHSTRATPPAANADRPASLRSVGSASTSGGSASQEKLSEITSVDTPAIGHEISTER
eukprot:scaffold52888_cov70-Phaeocystis_antarctica.AAC.4